LVGNEVGNRIEGLAGNDTMEGGAGDDTLIGGAGGDTFSFAATGNGVDRVTDFGAGDRILVASSLALQPVTAGDGTGVTGQRVQSAIAGGVTTLSIDTNSTPGAEVEIRLQGEFQPWQWRLSAPATGQVALSANAAPVLATALASATALATQTTHVTVPTSTFTDADGDTLSYTARMADGAALPSWLAFNAGSRTFTATTPGNAAAGAYNAAVVARDPWGAEATANFTLAVTSSNRAPTGTVTITGTPTQGQTLTAANTLVDPDGIPTSGSGAISYQWRADGAPISGATTGTFTLTEAQVGKAITVTARYTDNFGQAESVTSASTLAIRRPKPPTFSVPGDGKFIVGMQGAATDKAMALQADGKVVLAGSKIAGNGGSANFTLARIDPHGNMDAEFGNSGFVHIPFGDTSSIDRACSVHVLSNNKIIAVGTGGSEDINTHFWPSIVAVKLNSDGTLDDDFAQAGKFISQFRGVATTSVLLDDGSILIAGQDYKDLYANDILVVRVLSDGQLDTDFGTNGLVRIDVGSSTEDIPYSIAVQSDGRILIVGSTTKPSEHSNGFILRITSNGELDNSFSGDGKAVFGSDETLGSINSIELQADGKILLAVDNQLRRLMSDGSLDTSFSGDGIIETNQTVRDIELRSSGGFLVVGYQSVGRQGRQSQDHSGNFITLSAFDPNGSYDMSFSNGGTARLIFRIHDGTYGSKYTSEYGYDIELFADGEIILASQVYEKYNYSNDIGIARLNIYGYPNGEFDRIDTLNEYSTYQENGDPVALDPNVILTDEYHNLIGNFSGANLTLFRNQGKNSEDHFFGLGTLTLNQNGDVLLEEEGINIDLGDYVNSDLIRNLPQQARPVSH
jgi:uncharacterized delta-60 repeat protein